MDVIYEQQRMLRFARRLAVVFLAALAAAPTAIVWGAPWWLWATVPFNAWLAVRYVIASSVLQTAIALQEELRNREGRNL